MEELFQGELKKHIKQKRDKINAQPGNRTPVSTVGGYYDTTTPAALCPQCPLSFKNDSSRRAFLGNGEKLRLDAILYFPIKNEKKWRPVEMTLGL